MLSLVITLPIIALIAAMLGFGGVAGAAVGRQDRVLCSARAVFDLANRWRSTWRLRPAALDPCYSR